MNIKPEIVFTFPACMGGVSSFNFNIINHSNLIGKFHSKVILLKAEEDARPLFLDSFNADEVITFHYSYNENQYYVQKRLEALLGNREGVIVTDNAITIYAAASFNNPKTVFHLIHDYFYVNQAVLVGDMADVAIAHSTFFSDAVFASNPVLFAGRTYCIPYGVQQLKNLPVKKRNANLSLVFLGRLDESKGVLKLFEIDKELKKDNICADWTIIGKGPLKDTMKSQWSANTNISFFEPDSTEEVYEILSRQDLFIFPTTFEGTPVSILECMANGVPTICNDLPGGIRDIVNENTGKRCEINNLGQFVESISFFDKNRNALEKLQQNCFRVSTDNYDIRRNADNYFNVFLQYDNLKRKVKSNTPRVSRLDKRVFPNGMVKFLRGFNI